jgi:hypothetical protein
MTSHCYRDLCITIILLYLSFFPTRLYALQGRGSDLCISIPNQRGGMSSDVCSLNAWTELLCLFLLLQLLFCAFSMISPSHMWLLMFILSTLKQDWWFSFSVISGQFQVLKCWGAKCVCWPWMAHRPGLSSLQALRTALPVFPTALESQSALEDSLWCSLKIGGPCFVSHLIIV